MPSIGELKREFLNSISNRLGTDTSPHLVAHDLRLGCRCLRKLLLIGAQVENGTSPGTTEPKRLGQVNRARFNTPAGTTWKDIVVRFLGDHRIQVTAHEHTAHKHTEVFNFVEAGFEDLRTKNPNSAWILLCRIAKRDGRLERPNQRKEIRKVEKDVQELKKRLRSLFGIDEDPFLPFRPTKTYQAKFNLSFPQSDTR